MCSPMIRGPLGMLLGVRPLLPLVWWIRVASGVRPLLAVPSIQWGAVLAADCVRSGIGLASSLQQTHPLRHCPHLCDGGSTCCCSNAISRSNVFVGQIGQHLNLSTGLGIWRALHSSIGSYLMAWDVHLATACLTMPHLLALGIEFPMRSYSLML